ncbi:hypothetical protein HK100_008073, partial [Physocladia obscura]
TAILKSTNTWNFIKAAADNWRNSKSHRFSQGEWNNILQKYVPTARVAQFFLLRLIHSRAADQRFIVRSAADVHKVPTANEFEDLKNWFSENYSSIVGAKTGRLLGFLSNSGLDQASMDQMNPALRADQAGQEWILDGEGWNRYNFVCYLGCIDVIYN